MAMEYLICYWCSLCRGPCGISYVVFGDMPPLLINNELVINQNETISA